MSEEKASPCVLHIHGENIQVLPNAMFAIQYICLDPGEKPEVVSEKDVETVYTKTTMIRLDEF